MQARTPIEAVQEFQVLTGPVRRRVRPHDRRRHQRRHQERHQHDSWQRLRLLPGQQPDDQGLPGQAARPRQGRHQLPALGRRHRRARSSRTACTTSSAWSGSRSIARNTIVFPTAARPERPADDPGSRLEHDRPRRPPAVAEPYLQRPLAARAVAADRTRSCRRRRQRHVSRPGAAAREESDVDQSLAVSINSVLCEHQGEHAARHLDARERHLRQRLLQRERPRPGARAIRRSPTRTSSTSRTTPASSASTTASPSTTRSPGSCRASAAITTSRPACSTSIRAPRTRTRAT